MNYKKSLFRVLLLLQVVFLFVACNSIKGDEEIKVNNLLDEWHKAASNADFDEFFGKMHEDAIYLGTQADERWSKNEFIDFAKPFFDKGRAWSFKPFNRTLYKSNDANLYWFEESLKTWMGVCRGSGVFLKNYDEWKIIHYNLSVTISNDLVNDFIDVIKNDSINSFLLD